MQHWSKSCATTPGHEITSIHGFSKYSSEPLGCSFKKCLPARNWSRATPPQNLAKGAASSYECCHASGCITLLKCAHGPKGLHTGAMITTSTFHWRMYCLTSCCVCGFVKSVPVMMSKLPPLCKLRHNAILVHLPSPYRAQARLCR